MNKRGFTLLELLIVIAIIAILSVILIIVLNPAETLKKARDSQRLSDLNTLKTAIGIYLTSISSPDLDDASATICYTTTTGTLSANPQVMYSAEIANPVCTGGAAVTKGTEGEPGAFIADFCTTIGTSGATAVDGTGWVPVKLSSIVGGSPISNMPLDPTNTIATATAPASTDLVYRYVCQNKSVTSTLPSFVFEFNAQLESAAFTTGTDDKRAKDGGDTATLYEVGNSTRLITGTNY